MVVQLVVDKNQTTLILGRQLLPALFVALAVFASAEENVWVLIATLGVSILVPWKSQGLLFRAVRLFFTFLTLLAGPIALPLLAVFVFSSFGVLNAVISAALIALTYEWSYKIGLLTYIFGVSFSSAIALVFPAFMASISFIGLKEGVLFRTFFATILALFSVWFFLELSWIDTYWFTLPLTRLIFVILFVLLLWIFTKSQTKKTSVKFNYVISALLLGAFLSYGANFKKSEITQVVFDEAHGDWASTLIPLEPNDFGRNVTYSWRALSNWLSINGLEVEHRSDPKRFEAPSENGIYVLKMPLESVDEKFSAQLLNWVDSGGRLLVVADHTDLFDTTQNLNKFLEKINVQVDATAVFDRQGQPPVVNIPLWSGLNWITGEGAHRFLTGTSFVKIPWYTLPIFHYGMSYAEAAVYFRANRFGYFQPSNQHPFVKHIAVGQLSRGKGSIQIWLDSTHWSTFAVYQSTYQDSFLQLLKRASQPNAGITYAIFLGGLTLLISFALLARRRTINLVIPISFCLGGLIVAAFPSRINHAVKLNSEDVLHVSIGRNASVELLPPLVQSPERNYARALTSLQKWFPVRLYENQKMIGFSESKTILFIDPDTNQLPSVQEVLDWMADGKRVTILSKAALLTSPEQKAWLYRLGFELRHERRLVEERDVSSDLLGRRETNISRQSILRMSPHLNSEWTELESSHFAQVYVLRISQHHKQQVSGTIAFITSSNQFSDAAIGDVWDGIPVDDISRNLERRLANLVLGSGLANPAKTADLPVKVLTNHQVKTKNFFNRYLVVSGGKLQAEGLLGNYSPQSELSFSETPDAYAWRLMNEAIIFLPNCDLDTSSGYCKRTFIDSRLSEWSVIPDYLPKGGIKKLEIIHDGKLSGFQQDLHVIFEK